MWMDILGDSDLGSREIVLVLQHGRVEILGAVRHEVEAGHEQDQVGQQQPVPLDGDLALLDKGLADAAALRLAQRLVVVVRVRLAEEQAPNDEDGRRARAEPVEGAPLVGCRVD